MTTASREDLLSDLELLLDQLETLLRQASPKLRPRRPRGNARIGALALALAPLCVAADSWARFGIRMLDSRSGRPPPPVRSLLAFVRERPWLRSRLVALATSRTVPPLALASGLVALAAWLVRTRGARTQTGVAGSRARRQSAPVARRDTRKARKVTRATRRRPA